MLFEVLFSGINITVAAKEPIAIEAHSFWVSDDNDAFFEDENGNQVGCIRGDSGWYAVRQMETIPDFDEIREVVKKRVGDKVMRELDESIQELDKKPYVLKKVPTLKISRSAAEPGKLMGFYDAKVLTPEEVYQLVVEYLDAMEYGELP